MPRPQFDSYQQLREPKFDNPYSAMAFKFANKAFDSIGSALDSGSKQRDKNLAVDIANTKQVNDIAIAEQRAQRQANVDLFNREKFNITNQLGQQELAARIAHNNAIENKPSYAKEMYDLKEQARLKDEAIQTDAMKLSTSLTKDGLSEGKQKAYSNGDIETAKRYEIAIALQESNKTLTSGNTESNNIANLAKGLIGNLSPKDKTKITDINNLIKGLSSTNRKVGKASVEALKKTYPDVYKKVTTQNTTDIYNSLKKAVIGTSATPTVALQEVRKYKNKPRELYKSTKEHLNSVLASTSIDDPRHIRAQEELLHMKEYKPFNTNNGTPTPKELATRLVSYRNK